LDFNIEGMLGYEGGDNQALDANMIHAVSERGLLEIEMQRG
jgi:hypothetical protein